MDTRTTLEIRRVNVVEIMDSVSSPFRKESNCLIVIGEVIATSHWCGSDGCDIRSK